VVILFHGKILTKNICYVTGTRADFGLIQSTLEKIHNSSRCNLSIVVTGMHLIKKYGMSINEIKKSNFNIIGKIHTNLSGSNGAEMSLALSDQIKGFTNLWTKKKPDVVLLLGDRGEMLAGAIAAIHLNIHIVHIHGGERSGTIDESIRHSISKLAHYHLVATEESSLRLQKMGEKKEHILVTGAPGLDDISFKSLKSRNYIAKLYDIDVNVEYQLLIFHPVVQNEGALCSQMENVLRAATKECNQLIVFSPNADTGSYEIQNIIDKFKKLNLIKSLVNIPRHDYLSLLSYAEILIGNSSSGIIEAASLSTPVVNIGQRQNLREKNANVIDSCFNENLLIEAIKKAKKLSNKDWVNVYGNGNAGEKIKLFLEDLECKDIDLEKINAY
jgi:GDP/UDP-N,N'-diacetylbacillosamine 2-epimerase (hydrolysing)